MRADQLQRLLTVPMPYGKHLNWFAREGFPPGDIGRLLALVHEIDHNGQSELLGPLRPWR